MQGLQGQNTCFLFHITVNLPQKQKEMKDMNKHLVRICPDYNEYLWDDEDAAMGLNELYDKEGKAIQMAELNAWAQEMAPVVVASETGQEYEKDWDDYHQRGVALARQLREQLSPDFDLWYEAPFEDKSGTIPHRILIL